MLTRGPQKISGFAFPPRSFQSPWTRRASRITISRGRSGFCADRPGFAMFQDGETALGGRWVPVAIMGQPVKAKEQNWSFTTRSFGFTQAAPIAKVWTPPDLQLDPGFRLDLESSGPTFFRGEQRASTRESGQPGEFSRGRRQIPPVKEALSETGCGSNAIAWPEPPQPRAPKRKYVPARMPFRGVRASMATHMPFAGGSCAFWQI